MLSASFQVDEFSSKIEPRNPPRKAEDSRTLPSLLLWYNFSLASPYPTGIIAEGRIIGEVSLYHFEA